MQRQACELSSVNTCNGNKEDLNYNASHTTEEPCPVVVLRDAIVFQMIFSVLVEMSFGVETSLQAFHFLFFSNHGHTLRPSVDKQMNVPLSILFPDSSTCIRVGTRQYRTWCSPNHKHGKMWKMFKYWYQCMHVLKVTTLNKKPLVEQTNKQIGSLRFVNSESETRGPICVCVRCFGKFVYQR